jgi:hypothetical protein
MMCQLKQIAGYMSQVYGNQESNVCWCKIKQGLRSTRAIARALPKKSGVEQIEQRGGKKEIMS